MTIIWATGFETDEIRKGINMTTFNVKPKGFEVEVILPDKTRISGTYDNVSRALISLGYQPAKVLQTNHLYYSDSKGWIEISLMQTQHLRNAILKRYSEWLSEIRSLSNRELLQSLNNGPENLLGLVRELGLRVSKGE